MTSNGSDRWHEGLQLVSYCPVCETRYNPMEARLLGKGEETHLMHVTCRKCHHAILALVLVGDVGASSVGLITDLSYEDVLRHRGTHISVNDVIDAHRFFEKENWSSHFLPASPMRRRKRAVTKKKTS